MNTVQLVGRLTREVDLKFTSSGTAVGNFTLAVNRNFTNQQGEREADFINCVIWQKSAENLANFTRKGSQIGVEGRIQTRNYENQQGQKVYVTEVLVNQFHLLEPRSITEQRPAAGSSNNSNYSANRNSSNSSGGFQGADPFNFDNSSNQFSGNNNYDRNPSSSPFNREDGSPVDISEDDLPF